MKKFNKIQIFHKQEDYAVEYNDTELLQMAMAKDSDVIELAEKATDKVLDQIDDPDEWPLIRYRNFTDTVYEFRGKLTQHRYRTKDLLKSYRDVCMLMMIKVKTNSLIRKKTHFFAVETKEYHFFRSDYMMISVSLYFLEYVQWE